MAIIKCKMCGGDIEITADKTFGTCEFCGNTMTLPKVDDDQRAAMFNRGNHFRRIGEFDKALSVYEHIVREDDTDAEAHWCCALCRFGIEYVEDPNTYDWLPTCHRASFDNFLEDVDYLAAVEYSEGITRRQYQKDAAKIAEVQRGILVTSQSEEPFDVFICYKESDENGERTRDSLMAQDVYYQLTDQGYRVFFARITLENIGGKQYEPYIFAALNSAKVMVVIGTKPEYLSAVWVKNEWSRFLTMMKKDRSKLLLPCYRDIDPYDMPEQLSVLQSYDMSRIGFIQDLIRGVSKVLDAGKKPDPVKETTVVQQTAAVNTAAMLKRGHIALEDKEWKKADEFFEEVLNQEPENANAYLGKLMTELHVSKLEDLKDQPKPFDGRNSYQRILRYADEALRSTLTGYIDFINTRNETARLDGIYNKAKSQMDAAKTREDYRQASMIFASIRTYKDADTKAQECLVLGLESVYVKAKAAMAAAKTEDNFNKAAKLFESVSTYKDSPALAEKCKEQAMECVYTVACNAMKNAAAEIEYNGAANIFKRIPDYKDSAELMHICREKAEAVRKDNVLADGKSLMAGGEIRQYNAAVLLFKSIPGWKDADEMITVCVQKIAEIKAQEEENRQKSKREAELLRQKMVAKKREKKRIFIILIAVCAGLIFFGIYMKVIKPMQAYNAATALMVDKKFGEAIVAFKELGDYKDSVEQIEACNIEIQYNEALVLKETGKYTEAIAAFKTLKGYRDSTEQIYEMQYDNALSLMEAGEYEKAITIFSAISEYSDSSIKINECDVAILDNKYNEAMTLMDAEKYTEAISAFIELRGYKDSETRKYECDQAVLDIKYNEAVAQIDEGHIVEAYETLLSLNGYKDSTEKADSIYDQYKLEKLRVSTVGDYVFFGAYEQDNNSSNGKEDIEWLVLEVKDGKALVISKYALDCQKYNASYADVTWETCTLRKWLNNDFINSAFSADEKVMIPTATVSAVDSGNDTRDKVFLLSVSEVNKYSDYGNSVLNKMCEYTDYAGANGVFDQSNWGTCIWWLRSPRSNMFWNADYVDKDGQVNTAGGSVNYDGNAVRPAMWINIDE